MDPSQNPYSPGAGAQPPALVGRDRELEQFDIAVARLGRGLYDRSFLVSGLRGVGKTVLLSEYCSIAHQHKWAYQQIEAARNLDLPRVIADRIRLALLQLSPGRRVAARGRRVLQVLKSFKVRWNLPEGGELEVGVDPIPGRADTGILQEDLTDLFMEVGEYARERKVGVLITIDEAQYLDKSQLVPLLMGLHMIGQRNLPFMVVCAGLPSLPGLVGEARSYAERLFTFATINSLQPEESVTALTAPATRHDIQWDDDALARIVEETSGYPYFLQEFGKQAWNFATDTHRITLADVESTVPMAIRELDLGFFNVRFHRTTGAERAYLATMAALGPGPHPSGQVASRMGRTTPQVSTLRNTLLAKGLCYAPRYGEIAFTVPMFDQFLLRRLSS